MTTPASRRLVVVVDADPAFVEDARLLLQGERVLAARTTDEAAEIVTGGRVDLVVLGPSFGNESAVLGAGSLRVADPGVVIVLAAKLIAVAAMGVYFHFANQHVVADAAAIGRLLGPASLP